MTNHPKYLYVATLITTKAVIPAPISIGINSSRNPDVVPAKAGNQYLTYWIPPYQARGRLSQARNDKWHKTYVVIY
jgi:hypothetical protein